MPFKSDEDVLKDLFNEIILTGDEDTIEEGFNHLEFVKDTFSCYEEYRGKLLDKRNFLLSFQQ
jgi:hypothetical protein